LNIGFSQTPVEIKYTDKNDVFLNDLKLSKKTNFKTITGILGEPEVYKEYPTGKINYHYPDQGIVFHTVEDKLLFIGANFNWDGDETFPSATYTGKMLVDNTTIDVKSAESVLSELENIEVNCVFPGMCMTNPKKVKNVLVIGFEEGVVTQVGFEFQ